MKKLNQLLNIVIGAFIGVFVGHSLCVMWNYKTRPDMYYLQSAPWYTSILVYGLFTIAVVVICMLIKVLINYSNKKKSN